MSTEERWRSRVIEDGTCLVYPHGLDKDGYAVIWHEGRRTRVHRWTYEHFVGPIPDDLPLDHLCRNVACCLPSHLEPVTVLENTLRGDGITARNSRKTHCKNGHEFTPENTYIKPNTTHRQCRICVGQATARYLRKRRERTAGWQSRSTSQ